MGKIDDLTNPRSESRMIRSSRHWRSWSRDAILEVVDFPQKGKLTTWQIVWGRYRRHDLRENQEIDPYTIILRSSIFPIGENRRPHKSSEWVTYDKIFETFKKLIQRCNSWGRQFSLLGKIDDLSNRLRELQTTRASRKSRNWPVHENLEVVNFPNGENRRPDISSVCDSNVTESWIRWK